MSLLDERKLRRVLHRMLDEQEFLSPHGIRSLSAAHREGLEVNVAGQDHRMGYEPGESHTPMFGGNSNWRGPVWLPDQRVARARRCAPSTRSTTARSRSRCRPDSGRCGHRGRRSRTSCRDRLVGLFLPDHDGRRPSDGKRIEASESPLWRRHVTFSEYFDGDTGEGLGATHQTGWTALVAGLLTDRDCADRAPRDQILIEDVAVVTIRPQT